MMNLFLDVSIIFDIIVIEVIAMDVVRISKALADPIRFEILKRIAAKEPCCSFSVKKQDGPGVCVCDLVEGMGLIQSKVSYHIKELKEANLIAEETRGKWNYYSLKPNTLKDYLKNLGKELKL